MYSTKFLSFRFGETYHTCQTLHQKAIAHDRCFFFYIFCCFFLLFFFFGFNFLWCHTFTLAQTHSPTHHEHILLLTQHENEWYLSSFSFFIFTGWLVTYGMPCMCGLCWCQCMKKNEKSIVHVGEKLEWGSSILCFGCINCYVLISMRMLSAFEFKKW